MDNITHSLIGVVTAQVAMRRSRSLRADERIRKAALWAAVLGNNFPDLDWFETRLRGGGELGYLLYHRGYMHTLTFSPVLAALAGALALSLGKAWREPRRAKLALFALAWVSVLLHIAADFGNDYGVHPFSPFWNSWFYGGFIFIVEPWIWVVTLPQLVFGFPGSRVLPALGIAVSVLLQYLLWSSGATPPAVAAILTVGQLAALSLAAGMAWRRTSRGVPLWPSLSGLATIYAVFASCSVLARAGVRADIARAQPVERILNVSTTPAPGNPFCWRIIAQTEEGIPPDRVFRERVGVRSLVPSLSDPTKCIPWEKPDTAHRADLVASSVPESAAQFWRGEFVSNESSLERARIEHCRFDALLLWAREPYWQPGLKSGELAAGDLRFDSGRSWFARIQAPGSPGEKCLASLPPWDPPSGFIQR